MKQSELDFINTLRQATPYVERHRGKTFVIYLPGTLIAKPAVLQQLVQDIRLLHNLDIKIVLAAGATPQFNQALQAAHIPWQSHQQFRITTQAMLPILQQSVGQLRSQLEAAFSHVTGQPLLSQPITLLSGNWVIAQPKGVIEGIDFQHTGRLRKLQTTSLNQALNSGAIALLTPLAYSLTGELFNLNTLEQAIAVAQALQADKLMIYAPSHQLAALPQQLTPLQLKQQLPQLSAEQQHFLTPLTDALNIQRVHLLDEAEPDALLYDLFTRDGKGTLIFTDRYHQIRPAQSEDIGGIIQLIQPLEQQGVLVKRSREVLELEIEHFIVIERDQQIIGCAALYPHLAEKMGELACLAIDPNYQNQALGEQLLQAIEAQAKVEGITQLFILTTQSQHWFIEHGFQPSTLTALPAEKKTLYNYQRRSKVLMKPL
ncbi:amino-acid N-acetyltransferase [Galenea microaerophila]